MEHPTSYAPLLFVIGLAFIVPLLLTRIPHLRIPIVVGEIFAGIIIGHSGFNLIPEDIRLTFLADLGFAYLMFLSGLEVNLEAVLARFDRRQTRPGEVNLLGLGSSIFGLTLVGATVVAVALTNAGLANNPVLMGLILSTTSVGIVVPTLKERRLISTGYGQAVLIAALIADFATMILISVAVLFSAQGLNPQILLVLVLLAGFAGAMQIAQRLRSQTVLRRIFDELSHATGQLKTRGAFALALAFIVLAESLGVEVILGAFLAGAVVALLAPGEGSRLREKLDAIGYGFLIPFFFIMVGIRFDLSALTASPRGLLLAPLLLVAAFALKMLPALLFRRHYSWRETLGAGALLSARLSLVIAASAIGVRIGAISPEVNAAIILVAVITCTAAPLLFSRFIPEQTVAPRQGIIIIGLTSLALQLAQRLQRSGESVILLDYQADRLAERLPLAQKMNLSAQAMDGPIEKTLQAVGGQRARAMIVMDGETKLVLDLLTEARSLGIPELIANVEDVRLSREFGRLDVRVVSPSLATLTMLETVVRHPHTFAFLSELEDDQTVLDLTLDQGQAIGKTLSELSLPGDCMVLMIQRGEDHIVPRGRTRLQAGDHVTLIGSATSVTEAVRRLE